MHSIKRITVILVLLALLGTGSLWADYRLVIQAGHDAAPSAMEWHEKSRTIVSAGDDGRLIVTRPSDSRVLHRFRISEGEIIFLKTNPDENRAAVVSHESEGYVLRTWDWNEEKVLYEYKMETEPLFVSWSAHGRYLTVGQLSSPSILVLEGRTGRTLSYLRRLPSIYNDAYIGSTESILMTYSSSGSIRYWDIRSSALKLSAETVSNLRGLTVLQTGSKSTLFGFRNQTLYLLNRQTGAVLDQMEIQNLLDVSVDPENGELDVLASGSKGGRVYEYEVSSDRFLPRGVSEDALSPGAVPIELDRSVEARRVLRRNGQTFLLNEAGSILALTGTSDFQPLIDDKLWRPDSLAFQADSLFISSGSNLIRFNAEFFGENAKGSIDELNDLSKEEIEVNTEARHTGLLVLKDDSLLIWDKSSDSVLRGYSVIDTNDSYRQQRVRLDANVQKMVVLEDGRLLIVDRNGSISLVNPDDGKATTGYSALGILDAAYSSDGDYILAGRSSTGRAGTPLEMVDLQTRETVPIPDSRFMVYSITEGPRGLYSIGVNRSSRGSMSTLLLQHEKDNPSRTRTIMEVDGEDLTAVMLPHPSGAGIYTSLGGEVRKIVGNRKILFASTEPVKKLYLQGSILYGIDADGALLLWNADSGRSILRVHFFDDGGWIAIPPEGDTIWASPGAMENVVLYKDGRPVDPRKVSRTMTNSAKAN